MPKLHHSALLFLGTYWLEVAVSVINLQYAFSDYDWSEFFKTSMLAMVISFQIIIQINSDTETEMGRLTSYHYKDLKKFKDQDSWLKKHLPGCSLQAIITWKYSTPQK